jgi:hypothetical protein
MAFYRLVKLVLNSCIAKRNWLWGREEVLIIGLDVLLVLSLKLLSQFLVDLQHVSFVDSFLLVQVVHDEKVLSHVMLKVDVIDLVEVRLLVVNDIPEVVLVLKDILRWIHKNFKLIRNKNL